MAEIEVRHEEDTACGLTNIRKSCRVFHNVPAGLVFADLEGRILECNPWFLEFLNYDKEALIMRPFVSITHPDDARANLILFREMVEGIRDNYAMEKRYLTRDGTVRWANIIVTLVRDLDGEQRVMCVVSDLTGKRRETEMLRESIESKDMFVRELHHRMKNNLNIISSLLRIQARAMRDENMAEELLDALGRVRSISIVHEALHRSRDLKNINVYTYLRSLSSEIFRSFKADASKIRLSIEVPELYLAMDTLVPCGLILNEALTNSVKYAFPNDIEGEIHVSLTEEGEDYVLVVSDDGVGISGEIDPESAGSLGMEIIHSLARQLDGTASVSSDCGTTVRISFRKPPPTGL